MAKVIEQDPTYEHRIMLAEKCEKNALWFQASIHWREAAKFRGGDEYWRLHAKADKCIERDVTGRSRQISQLVLC